MDSYRSLHRRAGGRFLGVAFLIALALLYTVYSGYPRSHTPPTSFAEHTNPVALLEQGPPSSPTDVPASLPPPSPVHDEWPTTRPPLQSPNIVIPTPERSPCPVIKVSMLYGAHSFPRLQDALASHRRHRERGGCDFVSLDEELTSRKLYSKHYFLLSTLLQELSKPAGERKQWLMLVDADSILINPAISPCAFLPPDSLPNVFALETADHQGLNNGIFYLRVHSDSLDLLTQTADYPLAHPDEDLGWFGEQAAMENVLRAMEARSGGQGSDSGIAWIPRQWLNTFEFENGYEGQPGHFLVHFAGLGETRLTHMANWLAELQTNQEKWEVPLEKTLYADAIPRFWDEFAANATKQ